MPRETGQRTSGASAGWATKIALLAVTTSPSENRGREIDIEQHPTASPTRWHHELRALRSLRVDAGVVGPDNRAVTTVTALHDELNAVKVQVLLLFQRRLDGIIAQGLRLPGGFALPHGSRCATILRGPSDRRRSR
eukprot:scaffold1714_cov111-Isochrysis_galbana.AAC.4